MNRTGRRLSGIYHFTLREIDIDECALITAPCLHVKTFTNFCCLTGLKKQSRALIIWNSFKYISEIVNVLVDKVFISYQERNQNLLIHNLYPKLHISTIYRTISPPTSSIVTTSLMMLISSILYQFFCSHLKLDKESCALLSHNALNFFLVILHDITHLFPTKSATYCV